jgi:hypothetical protein
LNYFLEYISFFVKENEIIFIAIYRKGIKIENHATFVATSHIGGVLFGPTRGINLNILYFVQLSMKYDKLGYV